MANTCFNQLYFTGENANVQKANLFLSGLPNDQWGGIQVDDQNGYFQDIDFCLGKFLFGTRWEAY